MYTAHETSPTHRPTAVRLAPHVHTALLREAAAADPHEACGVLLGTSAADIFGILALTNRAADPAVTFEFNMLDATRVVDEWRTRDDFDGDIVAVWHSHPTARAWPSPTDLAYSIEPTMHVIVGRAPGEPWLIRAFYAVDGRLATMYPVTRAA